MAKQVIYSEDARKKIKAGIDKVANAVRVTMGPKGRNVLLGKSFGGPTITNDGVSIAKDIELKDPFENLGAELIKQVAEKTNDVAGDGTTTATVITQALVREGLKFVETGINPVGIRHGMERAKDDVIELLKKNSKKISSRAEKVNVATISAESKEMGEMVAGVMGAVGDDGVVTTEQSQTLGLSKEIVMGMNFDKGYISPYMMTDATGQVAEIKDPFILLTDKKISSIQEVLPVLEKMAQAGKKDIVIIAEDVDGEALATLIVNRLRGVLNVLAIKAPEFGENRKAMLEDIALLTGGQVISADKGMKLEATEISMLGRAARVVSTKDDTTIVGGKGKKAEINARIALIKAQADKTESNYDREKLVKRMAKLSGGVAVIRVGAATETELTYMKHKMEDAVAATKAAIAEGIVAGGGTALVKAAREVGERFGQADKEENDFKAGYTTVLKALEEPLRQIVSNAGMSDASVVLNAVLDTKGVHAGYNAATDQYETDMLKVGIIDPLKVTRTALENAVSVAALLLTTEAAVVELPEEKKTPDLSGMGGGMGMPGMM
ncbi:MAG: chaperonin GroEL [Candidatus Moraniibacteriota bacterium]|nr:MAG: chaperonin GroEL [Candidatus Moranbacteria bacterium]